MADTKWKKRRLVNPDRPGMCIHGVPTAKGFWCSECIALKVGGYKCPAHRTGLKVTVTERHDRTVMCSKQGCTYQAGHRLPHSDEELDFSAYLKEQP